jgi:hypothetical protein
MKNKFKKIVKPLQLLTLAALLSCPISSQARVVENINQAMTDLLGHAPAVTSVYQAQAQGLDEAGPKAQPWSSSYWPDILGGISNHYRQRAFIGDFLFFLLRYDAAKGRFQGDSKDVCDKYQTWSPDDLAQHLSPTEKYDLLLGDTNFTFTKNVMADIDFRAQYRKTSVAPDGVETDHTDDYAGDDNTGQFSDVQSTYSRFDNNVSYKYWQKKGGSIAYWFGICDGWSPAAVTLPRPQKPVTVTGALGHQITFFPDDLKALGDYLFARTNNDYMTTMDYHFAGRPCGAGSDPEVNGPDEANPGRVKDFRCNDVDAGVWHLTLLNRVGKDKMGFVFEVDNNKKINNHPVSNYSLKYISPITGAEGTLRDSMVPLHSVKDSYANRRNPNTVYLVGVKSKFTFLNYQWPEAHHNDSWNYDSADQDKTKTKEYTYDLELDANGNVLGGEWGDRSQEMVETTDENDNTTTKLQSVYADQPDFIWMGAPKNLPHSEMSTYTTMGTLIDQSNPRPFGNMHWAWDGDGRHLPADWMNAAKSDEMWQAPVVGVTSEVPGTHNKVVSPPEAKDSIMKSAQPLSNIVFYLFDKARDPSQR